MNDELPIGAFQPARAARITAQRGPSRDIRLYLGQLLSRLEVDAIQEVTSGETLAPFELQFLDFQLRALAAGNDELA